MTCLCVQVVDNHVNALRTDHGKLSAVRFVHRGKKILTALLNE